MAIAAGTVLSPEKERQILAGAGRVFANDGYEGASMSRIALAAGVSKGTLYNYFASKADLFAAHVRQMCAERLASVFGDIPDDGPIEATLQTIGRRMLQMFLSETGLAIHRVVLSEAVKFPALAQTFNEAGPQAAMRRTAAIIHAQVTAGHLAADDPDFAAEQLCALMQTTVLLQRRLNLIDGVSEAEITRVVESGVRLFLRGYGVVDKSHR